MAEACKPGELTYRSNWETARTISHDEAREIAGRLIASHFRRADCETARASIPARPDYDDDLLIVSYIKQQARRDAAPTLGETFASIAAWAESTFGPILPARIVGRADEEMVELRADPESVEEAADVVICLARYPDLWAVVERKMAVNRQRRWRRVGDGTGYHIKPGASPDSDSVA